jgi:uncharacterized protein YqgV (UPF0045/DUF77 family)
VVPRDDETQRRRGAEAVAIRNVIAELERLLELLRARLVELVPVGSRTPSASEIAKEVIDYLEEKTNPGIEPRRLPPPAPTPLLTESERVRRKVAQVLDEGKARRWDDLSKTSRGTVIAVALAAGLGIIGRVLEAAIRGHW